MYKDMEVNKYGYKIKSPTPPENDNKGKRRHARIEKPFITRLRVLQQDGLTVKSSRWDIVKVIDLSGGGMSFNYTQKLEKDTKLEFNISLPFTKESVSCIGVVCRADQKSVGGLATKIPMYSIAVRFIDIDKDKIAAIDKFAAQF